MRWGSDYKKFQTLILAMAKEVAVFVSSNIGITSVSKRVHYLLAAAPAQDGLT